MGTGGERGCGGDLWGAAHPHAEKGNDMTDKTFEIIKIGRHLVLRVFHTEPGYLPVCVFWQRISATQKKSAISGMRDRGYCYQGREA